MTSAVQGCSVHSARHRNTSYTSHTQHDLYQSDFDDILTFTTRGVKIVQSTWYIFGTLLENSQGLSFIL